MDRLLERQRVENGGRYPETIAVVLWGTDNIKTYGESLAQVMIMVGVRPVSDALGRVNKLEVSPAPGGKSETMFTALYTLMQRP